MKLIEEYESLTRLHSEDKSQAYFRYSELLPDLEYIQKQLDNAQINLHSLDAFSNKMPPANLHIITDAKNEKIKRQRYVQVHTAQRVIKRFCPDKIQKFDKEIQTDTEQIAVFKEYYENQIDAMMDREIDVKIDLKQAVHKLDMQKNRIDMLDRRVEEMKTLVDLKRQQLEEKDL